MAGFYRSTSAPSNLSTGAGQVYHVMYWEKLCRLSKRSKTLKLSTVWTTSKDRVGIKYIDIWKKAYF